VGKAVGIVLCIVGAFIALGPVLYAYFSKSTVVEKDHFDNFVTHNLDLFDWVMMYWRFGGFGFVLIATGVTIFVRN
jgi:cell division protein FtsX